MEYKYGKTKAENHLVDDMRIYLRSTEKADPALIRYQYEEREDMYDRVSYNKGGCVLHMLRTYLGDSAFFKGFNLYLNQNKFSSVEGDNLRQAFEKTSGEDLNWFFNQWYYKGGHPILNVSYKWDETKKTEIVKIKQVQDLNKNPLYKLPLDIDFYFNDTIERKKITVTKNIQEFEFAISAKPNVVSVDAERSLVGSIVTDRPIEETIYLFDHSKHVRDRSQAVTTIGFVMDTKSPESTLMRRALKDPAEIVRKEALIYASIIFQNDPESIKDLIFDVALHDSSTENRKTALERIKTYYKAEECVPLFEECLKDLSHRVVATAFDQLKDKDAEKGARVALQLESDSSSEVMSKLATYYADNDSTDEIRIFKKAFRFVDRWEKYGVLEDLGIYAGNHYNLKVVKAGVDLISTDALGSSFDHYKSTCGEVLNEISDKLNKALISFNKNVNNWTKYNQGMSSDEIRSELSNLQIYIESKRNEIKNVR
jgi:aminopeptidase N